MSKELVIAGKGDYFVNKKTEEEVVVFVVERNEIGYAPVGKSSEFRLPHQDFLDQFEYKAPEKAPEPAKEKSS
jgi:hypothetical protein